MVQIQTYHDASTVVIFMLLSIARRYQTPLLKQKKKIIFGSSNNVHAIIWLQ